MANISLNIGLNALLTAQSALDSAGHNIANANTPGYSRQNLQRSTSLPINLRGLHFGTGVQADKIVRTVDDLLGRRILSQASTLFRHDSILVGMQEIESVLGEPGGFGIGGLLDDFFGNMSSLSANPDDVILRTGLTQSASAMTDQFHDLSRELEEQRYVSAQRINYFTAEVNNQASLIYDLNQQIMTIEASGLVANDLRDQRDMALRSLAEQVDISSYNQGNGSVRVLLDGQMLVGQATVNELNVDIDPSGEVTLMLEGATTAVDPGGGAIGGLIEFNREIVPQLTDEINTLAYNLIREMNREHAQGIPTTGGFSQLTGSYIPMDRDGDGQVSDELLAYGGLPFEMTSGSLFVNVTDTGTGEFTTHQISVDPDSMTIGGFADAISNIPGLTGQIDSAGRIQILAESGKTFDFSPRLNTAPDAEGTFGGGRASLGSTNNGPFDLAGSLPGTMFDFGTFSIEMAAGDFTNPSAVSAEEFANAFNSDPDAAANLVQAVAVGEQVFIQTLSEGSTETFTIASGAGLGVLGLAPGATATGSDTAVNVQIHGDYTGTENQAYTFRPTIDGQIGTTPGLLVEVYNSAGQLVTTLDVGAGYNAGNELAVADGLAVSFSFGVLSATDNDAFVSQALVNSDTSDVLLGLGLNSFYEGSDASTIKVRQDLIDDPRLFSASKTGAAGDGGNLLKMVSLQQKSLTAISGNTLGQYYGDIVGGIGFDISGAQNSLEVESFLLESLDARRDQVSGVNLDEELVNIIEYEQAFAAAAQFIQVVNQLNDEILNLI